MDSSDIRIDITLRLETARSQHEIQQLLRSLGGLDGIGSMHLADVSRKLLRLSFDPYRLSARDILKWFAQQTIKADIVPPASQAVANADKIPQQPRSLSRVAGDTLTDARSDVP